MNLFISRSHLIKLLLLALMVLAITSGHYLTSTHAEHVHNAYRLLYYVPIVLGGFWFSLRGGMGTSILVSVVYAPHVLFQWGHVPHVAPEKYLEILIYNLIGCITGVLAGREKAQSVRYRRAANRLEESYATLREQADFILEMEEQLRRSDRLSALGELSAGMAHEIRNPLGSIRGTAEILRDAFPPEDRRFEFAEILVKETDRLNNVVKEFLQFARPCTVSLGRFDLSSALDEVIVLARRQIEKGGIEILWQKSPVPKVSGDREQMKQAFLNLILNAAQAMPDGGELRICADLGEGAVELSFCDNGMGIAPDHLKKIFNPFFTTRHEGTGLGLAITHRIVTSTGGRIDVKSEPGQGACFKLSLPLAGNEEC